MEYLILRVVSVINSTLSLIGVLDVCHTLIINIATLPFDSINIIHAFVACFHGWVFMWFLWVMHNLS